MIGINNVLMVVTLCASFNWAKELSEMDVLGATPKICTYDYAFEMYGANCAGLRLNKLPKNLRSGIEILDFSENKLKEINSDTFSRYTSIRFLYLADNQLFNIEEDGLMSLTYLESLDLSNNVILELPTSILKLPALRKLTLKGNPLLHKKFKELVFPKPIMAPLEYLDISDCGIKELPYLGTLPRMTFYNISHNPLTALDVKHFAAMCKLSKVDMSDSFEYMRLCDLRPVVSWFQLRNVYFQLEAKDYDRLNLPEFSRCRMENSTAEQLFYNATYNSCEADYFQSQSIRASRRTWLTIGGGLFGFLVGFILLLWVMHRHNVAQTRTTTEKLKDKPKDDDKTANAVLLNNAAYA